MKGHIMNFLKSVSGVEKSMKNIDFPIGKNLERRYREKSDFKTKKLGFSLIMWYIKVLRSERSRIPNFPVPIWSFLMHNDHFAPTPSVYIDVESLELDHRFF